MQKWLNVFCLCKRILPSLVEPFCWILHPNNIIKFMRCYRNHLLAMFLWLYVLYMLYVITCVNVYVSVRRFSRLAEAGYSLTPTVKYPCVEKVPSLWSECVQKSEIWKSEYNMLKITNSCYFQHNTCINVFRAVLRASYLMRYRSSTTVTPTTCGEVSVVTCCFSIDKRLFERTDYHSI